MAWWFLASAGGGAAQESPNLEPVRVVYFTTQDREPCSNRVERLGRLMGEVQRFYREGMAAAGYGRRTFALERDAAGALRIHDVRAREMSAAYGRDAADKVRGEVKAALAREGIQVERETVVIFQTLLRWEGEKAVEVGPYVGAGDHEAGIAWVYDDDRLDPELLGSKAPGGYYGRACSLGEFNSHYVGGVAHELGHGFGLPHICETPDQASRGHALMGGGNHTYGEERRGEGRGSFLHPVSAMRLAKHRRFAGAQADAARQPDCRLVGLRATREAGALVLEGRLTSDLHMEGVAVYDDWADVPSDYDAYGWLGRLEPDGSFRVELKVLRRGTSQLRLTVAHANGRCAEFPVDYVVDEQGGVDPALFAAYPRLAELPVAFSRGDSNRLAILVQEAALQGPAGTAVGQRARHLLALLEPPALRPLQTIPPTTGSVLLSTLELQEEEVGWGRPWRDRVLAEGTRPVWLQVGGRFFASGLYAHAPARHTIKLTAGWSMLATRFGLQDGADGSVVFVVRGDGRELYRSAVVRDHQVREARVALGGIGQLDLVVEDAGDGAGSDWGVWLEPRLER